MSAAKKYPCIICKKLLTPMSKECCDTCMKNYLKKTTNENR